MHNPAGVDDTSCCAALAASCLLGPGAKRAQAGCRDARRATSTPCLLYGKCCQHCGQQQPIPAGCSWALGQSICTVKRPLRPQCRWSCPRDRPASSHRYGKFQVPASRQQLTERPGGSASAAHLAIDNRGGTGLPIVACYALCAECINSAGVSKDGGCLKGSWAVTW